MVGGIVSVRAVARCRAVAVLLVLAVLAVLVPAVPAEAVDVRTFRTERLLGGVSTQQLEVRLPDGRLARGDIIRFQEDDPGVELRSRLARGRIAGLETMGALSERAWRQGAVAGVNGGYFFWNAQQLAGPIGAPNGLFVDRGRLEQGQAVTRSGRPTGRAVVGWQRNGRMVMDRVRTTHTYERLGGVLTGGVDDLNRQPWRDAQVLLYTDRFGTTVSAPAGAVAVTLDGMALTSTGATSGAVTDVRFVRSSTALTVPEGRHLLLATGARAAELDGVGIGEDVTVRTRIAPETGSASAWDGLFGGVAGGQLLVRDGVRRPADEWGSFASFGDAHVTNRRARTAIGRTGDGRVLLVTIDESSSANPGWSSGVTVRQLADVMLALGARDAVNLDGGGSTTQVRDGRVVNRPSQPGRAVADAIFVHVPRPAAARALTEACTEQVLLASTGFVDVVGTTHAEAITCLSGWAVTRGVTPTTYAPNGQVTRAQMASFLARWIDDHAERGSGTALPAGADLPFADVRAGSVHAEAIARLSAAGVIQGRSATSYAPAAPVTRAQTASLVARSIEYVTGTPLPRGRDTFTDDNGNTHEASIDRLAATGIVTGVGGFSYRPADPVTRGAMASILMRASAELVEAGVAVPPGGDGGAVVAGG